MERFAGFCNDHVMGYYKRTARKGFLWCKQIKKMLSEAEEPQDKVTKVCEIHIYILKEIWLVCSIHSFFL